jgi:hypothetical protein
LLGSTDSPPNDPNESNCGESRRHEATEPAAPEAEKVKRPGSLPLADEQIRDEEPREGEKRRDSEKPSLGPTKSTMEEQNTDNGEPANAVEGREMR